jgi:hypothetical protein
MVCTVLTTADSPIQAIVCGPARRYRRFYGDCDVCKRRTAQARRWDGMYYGYTEVCLPCGTECQDGIALSKPSREMAKRWWREAEPAAQFDAWVAEQQRSYFEDDDFEEAAS